MLRDAELARAVKALVRKIPDGPTAERVLDDLKSRLAERFPELEQRDI